MPAEFLVKMRFPVRRDMTASAAPLAAWPLVALAFAGMLRRLASLE